MIKLALRNLARQRRRSLLVGFLFAFASATLVFNASVANGVSRMIDESVQRYLTGNVVIKSIENRSELGKLRTGKIPTIGSWREVEKVLEASPAVRGVAKRVSNSAMVRYDHKQSFATLYGVQQKGTEVIPLDLSAGQAIGDSQGAILISQKLATTLGASIGELVSLMGVGLNGEPKSISFQVKGIIATTHFDLFRQTEVQLSYPDAQALFGLDGAPTEYLLAAADSDRVVRDLASRLSALPVTVQPWTVAGGAFLQSKEQLQVSVLGMFALFGIVIAAILFNMVQMQIQERFREIGTMSALGMAWPQILHLLMVETFMLGLVSSAVGSGLMYAGVAIASRVGIAWGESPAAIFGGTILRPSIGIETVALFVMSLTLLGLLGALLPAWRGARVSPAESLRTI